MAGGSNGLDEMDCGSFFDHIDDLLDFPGEDIDAGLPGSLDSFPSIWSTQSDSLPGSDSVFSNNGNSDLSAELSVPYEDIVQLEWLSTFVEDSFSGDGSLTMKKQDSSANNSKEPFHTTSPVSVLESSSSYCYADKPGPGGPEPCPGKRGQARSKRPRPATFNPRPAIQLMSSTTSETAPLPQVSPKAGSSDSENYAESRPVMIKIPKKQSGNVEEKKKKKKIKLTVVHGSAAEVSPSQSPQAVRKCLHCEITKTPQWRAGPLGPKTLCNACGVRYKSGRLFPEYRPAASPTFIPSVHSNSHKKVIEMRTRMGDPTDQVAPPKSTMPASPELIPNTTVPLDYM